MIIKGNTFCRYFPLYSKGNNSIFLRRSFFPQDLRAFHTTVYLHLLFLQEYKGKSYGMSAFCQSLNGRRKNQTNPVSCCTFIIMELKAPNKKHQWTSFVQLHCGKKIEDLRIISTLLYEMTSNPKGKNFISKIYCYQNTMESICRRKMPLDLDTKMSSNNITLNYHKCHQFQMAKSIIIKGHFFIKIRWHQQIDFAGNTCRR